MFEEEIKYINMILEEIIESIDQLPILNFETERLKIIYISNTLNKINGFIMLIKLAGIPDDYMLHIAHMLNFNIERLIEISGYTEKEIEIAINEIIKK